MHVLQRFRGVFMVMMVAMGMVSPAVAQSVDESESIQVNVIACVDPDCLDTVNIVTMEGASVASLDAAGAVMDSCTVTITPSGMSLCMVAPAPAGGSYSVTPTAAYSGFVLLSTEPEVFESEMHGAVSVWYFAPEKDNSAPTPTQVPGAPVTELPSTGTGGASYSGLMAIGAFVLSIAGIAATVLRRGGRG